MNPRIITNTLDHGNRVPNARVQAIKIDSEAQLLLSNITEQEAQTFEAEMEMITNQTV